MHCIWSYARFTVVTFPAWACMQSRQLKVCFKPAMKIVSCPNAMLDMIPCSKFAILCAMTGMPDSLGIYQLIWSSVLQLILFSSSWLYFSAHFGVSWGGTWIANTRKCTNLRSLEARDLTAMGATGNFDQRGTVVSRLSDVVSKIFRKSSNCLSPCVYWTVVRPWSDLTKRGTWSPGTSAHLSSSYCWHLLSLLRLGAVRGIGILNAVSSANAEWWVYAVEIAS